MRWWRIALFGPLVASVAGGLATSGLPGELQAAQRGNELATDVGLIAGRVVDGLTGSPVAQATVTLSAFVAAIKSRTIVTDSTGRFEFSALPPAPFRMSVRADGYVGGSYGALAPGDAIGNRIVLQPAERIGDVTLRIWPAGSISGAVTDERGEPAVGLQVRFLRRIHQSGRSFWAPSSPTTTNDRGQFMRVLNPGDYLVVLMAEPPSRSASAVSHEGVFYGGGRTVATATVVSLGPGERREGVDLVTTFTPKSEALSVSGVVVAPESVPMLGYVGLVRSDAEDPIADLEGFRAWIRQEGRFSFSHVPPGEYRLRFALLPNATKGASTAAWGIRTIGQPAPVSDVTTWYADRLLSLKKSVNDLEVRLVPGSRIRGRVVFEGRSKPLPVDALRNVIVFVHHAGNRDLLPIRAGGIEPDGSFQTAGLPPGKYVLEPHAYIDDGRYVLTSVRVGRREVLGAPLDVGTTDLTGVVLTVGTRTWHLSGVVRDQAGRPMPEARVILFPRDSSRWRMAGFDSAREVTQLASDRAGVFNATGAIAGEYLAATVAAPPQSWMTPEFLETLVPQATPVRLALDDKRVIELRAR